ncbi:MAG: tetratricopeptide repeat protein [Pseudomonadota bacterium]
MKSPARRGRLAGRLAICCFALAGCETEISEEFKQQSLGPVNVVDATNMNEIMLSVGDPDAAVEYFRNALAREPERTEFKRGYAQSLARAGRHSEAVLVYRQLMDDAEATTTDRLVFATSLMQMSQFDEAEELLALVPPNANSYRYNLLMAMLSDHNEAWVEADLHYDNARRLTTRPARVLNNWGISHRVRGDSQRAVELFEEAITFDPEMFEAKNNLVITRGIEGVYQLPVIPMSETDRAKLYHNLAIVALRRNEPETARGLLERAVETHPQHFAPAAEKLAALDGPVLR